MRRRGPAEPGVGADQQAEQGLAPGVDEQRRHPGRLGRVPALHPGGWGTAGTPVPRCPSALSAHQVMGMRQPLGLRAPEATMVRRYATSQGHLVAPPSSDSLRGAAGAADIAGSKNR